MPIKKELPTAKEKTKARVRLDLTYYQSGQFNDVVHS